MSPQVINYTKLAEKWGLPGDLDAAFQHANGNTYFFKKGNYWRASTWLLGPRPAGIWWFGCQN